MLRIRGEEVFIRILIHDARIKIGDDEDGMVWFRNLAEEERRAAILSVDLSMIDAFARAGYCDDCILKRLRRSPYALYMIFERMSNAIEDFNRDIKEMEAKVMAPGDVVKALREKHNLSESCGSRAGME
jgi:hypothetical protein